MTSVETLVNDTDIKKIEEEIKDVVVSVEEVWGKSWSCFGWELLVRKVQPSPLPVPSKPEASVVLKNNSESLDAPAKV